MNGHALGTTRHLAYATATAPGESDETDPAAEGLRLFRRALEDGDPAAWEALVSRYRGLVLDWVRRARRGPIPHEHEDDWVTRTFERFWLAVGPEGSRFRDLAAALQYLKLCVRSVVLDDVRASQQAAIEPLDDLDERRVVGTPGAARTAPDVESVVFDRMASRELWQAVLDSLPDEDERLIAYLSFVQEMKPAEIVAAHAHRFGAVADVYRIKRNAIDRLRRSPQILARLGAEAPARPPVRRPARLMALAA